MPFPTAEMILAVNTSASVAHGPVALPANAPTPAAPAAEEAAAFPEPAALKPTVPEPAPPADGRAFAENDGSCAQQAR